MGLGGSDGKDWNHIRFGDNCFRDNRISDVPTPRILLVEDEEADVVHFQRICRKQGLQAQIVVARNADAALETLRKSADEPERYIVVTDLNMPGLTGHELIQEIRGDARLSDNVIFVLSTSDLSDDIKQAYSQHVAGYIIKDPRGERLEASIRMLAHYLDAVTLH